MSYRRFAVRRFAVAWMAGALALAGCAVGPDYRRPETPLPARWGNASEPGISMESADLARWWTAFKDPVLDSLVERAVRSNPDLRLAEARIREARATRAATAAGAWPGVDVSGSYTRSRSSEHGSVSRSQGNATQPSQSLGVEQDLFRTGFDASWEIDFFGRVRRSVEAADALIEATVEDRRNALVTLLGEVARSYVDLRGFQQRLAVTRANFKAQQDTLELTRVRFTAGLASDLDVARAESQVNTTAAQIPVLEAAIKQAAHRLDVLLGSEPGALWSELSKEAPTPTLPPEALVGLPSELLRRRPDIRGAERRLAAATAQVGAATADLFPRFSLTGAFGLQSVSASDWWSAPSRFWSIGPTLRWPVFDAGRIRANIEVRNAQQEQALRQYEKTILTALEEVENALVSYAREQARHRSLLAAVAANRRAVEMANELYLRGLNDFLNVLDAQRSLYAAENDLAQSRAAMASNLVALYKALGGGWDID
ncbi:MAG TPA: efflux transporter outer membrane subunit [candidate division Zixibacteria bacterium]|nr:efflux transporter outer membrane subunit [candidate division Zixibacteria bacterium]